MKAMKKLTSVLLVILFLFSPLANAPFELSVFAATSGYYTYTVSSGKATITDVSSSISGAVTIPSTLGGYPVTKIGYEAFYKCTRITSVIIPNSVVEISISAFGGCTSLTTVEIPDSVTYMGEGAFINCTSLASVTLSNSLTEIGFSVFQNCCSLKTITIPDGVTSIWEAAFYDCTSLLSVTLPDSLTSICEWSFGCCASLTYIDIPSGVTDIGPGAFSSCESLKVVNLPKSIKTIEYDAFYDCDNLSDVWYIGTATTRKKISIEEGNADLTTATWHYIDNENDTICNSCGKKYVPYNATGDCTWSVSGKTLTISGSGKMADYTFYVDNAGNANEASTAPWCYYDISNVVIESGVTYIGDFAFAYISDSNTYRSPTSISIPPTVKTIGESAFFFLFELESVALPKNVVSIESGAFGNTGLTDVWYEGTSSDRNKISFDSYNEELTSVTWHYNSCMENPSSTNKTHSYSNACDTTCDYCGKTRTATSHTYSSNCDASCNICGVTRTAPHSYSNACDTSCNECGVTRTITHYTKTQVSSAAHTTKNDSKYPFTQSGGWTVSTNKTKSTTSTYVITASHACTLTLNYKVSSEAGYDKMTVKKNSTTMDTISGEVEKSTTITLAKGDTVTVSYAKDGRTDGGNDCAYFKFSCTCASEQEVPSSTLSPTCTQGVVCSRCGVTVKAATGHKYDNACDTTCNNCGVTRTTGAHVYDNTCDETCNECGATRTVTHTYSNACDTTCNVCGATRTAPAHIYDGVCDETCNECGEKRSVTHTYDDDYDETCNVCGAVRSVVLALRTTLSKSVIDHGDTVVVSFSLTKPVMIKGFGLDYSAIYDKDAFEWVSGDWSEQIRANSILAQVNPGTQAVFAAMSEFNVSGEIFTMTLRVKDGAKCGIQKIDAPQITQIQNVTLFGLEIKVNHVFDDAKDLICNACGYERPPYTPGDTDGNGKVEMADAIYLLFHVNFPTNYSVNQPVDFDGNGKVEMADAIYLLFHINFPANYPLHEI